MDFVIENMDKKNYNGNILFYWLERNIQFKFSMDKLKQIGDNTVLKLENKLPGTYRLGHDFKNKNTNKVDKHTINIYSEDILDIGSDLKTRFEWIYFEISEEKVILPYEKETFIKAERDVKLRTSREKIEYWNNFWKCLHFISYTYPGEPNEELRESMLKLLVKLEKDGLKCNICKQHFRMYLKKLNREYIVKNRKTLKDFFFHLHNDVNRRNKKKILSENEVDELYRDLEKIKKDIETIELDLETMLKENKIHEFPDKYNTVSRKILKKKWGLFVLVKQ